MNPVEVLQGDSPVVLGLPHTGTFVPDDILSALNARGKELSDTDWHIHRLYDGLLAGATTVRATFHRYVIDANRDPSGASLYPGQNTTGLVPMTDFDGHDIWQTEPDAAEIERRRVAYHAPYHAALQAELERVKARHGVAILYDCHSIRSDIPFLFDGTLPDFNIGTDMGRTCAPQIEAATVAVCAAATQSHVLNGRFKGGWTTRHYGQPASGIHAIQMELAQSTYLTDEAAPWTYDETKSRALRIHLQDILTTLAEMAPQLKGTS
ncbi:N-formylglutamate deformylase [Sulfitobacter pseudonitzschiae]|uniref:N-formylglutamate deformylase n=1 Tax=Pseudosulfitobacter pseudonitzschiae TaxID=1402135 RepID=A0A9Q2NKC9_9RHOB|nr:N-formylglutamate deformylase [Pseudosulfitobacter pseudonitzschiae]MBM2291538.1 N-formylglutamate deformylase [Pseudosulfitobacter pseudonitzschiae]MBM2296456.1 N-formylglutamate deformylase [Pseudosulfitobacter pseudonitzschiae]MBM2301369.1 N-formylglutamate deformylase [Pseudosulfitobacter pseudonitzschiae]MBM2311153.1 N-formylglutamate deformylase [Pseudosulfitobacter pseudonitzschiae]MBM2316066.1 N-formylglutamate deformylase [Pseudosulfitobacter pseudonitzschiae]